MRHRWIGPIALTLLVFFQSTQAQYGYVSFTDATNTSSVKVCSAYNDLFKPVPALAQALPSGFVDNYPDESCSNHTSQENYDGKMVFIKRGNCTFAQKARNLQNQDAAGVIVVSDTNYFPPSAQASEYDEVDIFVALISKKSFDVLMEFQQNLADSSKPVALWLYAGEAASFDLSGPLLLLFGVIICSAGAWWQKLRYLDSKSTEVSDKSEGGNKTTRTQDNVMNVSSVHVVVYVFACSASLLLMYKFYSYLVYFVIGIFFIGSTFSLFSVLRAIFERTAFFSASRVPYCRIEACDNKKFSFCGFMLFLASVAVSSTWLIYRNATYSWILIDLLGASFCMYGISMLRLPNFKISATLLSLFFFYDIFYVFLTPYLTSSGDSIMVAVATGSGSDTDEEIPGMFKMPKFNVPECGVSSPSMVGFGDILLPGLHVGLCAVWDSKVALTSSTKTNVYYITGVAAYALGLILCSIALNIMQMGQPALLYIVPSLLLVTSTVAWLRGEMKAILRGFPDMQLEDDQQQQPAEGHGERNSLLSENYTNEI